MRRGEEAQEIIDKPESVMMFSELAMRNKDVADAEGGSIV
jgi:hypothetical protein